MNPITVHEERLDDAAGIVDTGLGDYNESAAPLHAVRHLACYLRDDVGRVQGGAVGRTWGENAELQQLWLPPAWRGRGLGAALVQQFESAAHERGACRVYLDTFSFQAPAFYERLGYRRALEIAGYAPGISRFTMLKDIGSA